nr:MAG TPA: hypothetical protein [Caudoviricetes sp.]
MYIIHSTASLPFCTNIEFKFCAFRLLICTHKWRAI